VIEYNQLTVGFAAVIALAFYGVQAGWRKNAEEIRVPLAMRLSLHNPAQRAQ
jgi:hypothetical protein